MSSCFCTGKCRTLGYCPAADPSRWWEALTAPIGATWDKIESLNGWKCPVCGRGNAPTTKTCPCFKGRVKYK